MRLTVSCPDEQHLRLLLQGRLSDDEAGDVERHLLACPSYMQSLQRLEAEDTLALALRDPGELLEAPPDVSDSFIRRLKELRPPATASGEDTAPSLPPGEARPSTGSPDQWRLDF